MMSPSKNSDAGGLAYCSAPLAGAVSKKLVTAGHMCRWPSAACRLGRLRLDPLALADRCRLIGITRGIKKM
uniref:Uncharacterized protein n=1 Tax=Paraburkholderia sprentiae WSM5005 TaxID=754502 RepID=A0A1I9YSX5_9BURK